jgi:hypothetical protein
MSRLPPGAATHARIQHGLRLGISIPYFQSRLRANRKLRPAAQLAPSRCYHHKWYETANHRACPGHRSACCRALCGATNHGSGGIGSYGAGTCHSSRGSGGRWPGSRTKGRPSRHSRRTVRQPGCRRVFASLSPGWRHSLARSDRGLLFPACACFWPKHLALQGELRAGT